MSSRMSMKTYSRQKVCQSSIQFDQLLNDKSNKPSAAKSKGTLHRWGMTSFTSMRNVSQLNGRKDTAEGESGGSGGGTPASSSVSRLLSKRRRTNQPPAAAASETSDDPFSFEAEADATLAASAARSSPQPNSALSGRYPPSEAAARSNKFFKSGARPSAFRAARPHLADGDMIVEAVELPIHCYDAADLINLSMQPVELIKSQQHQQHATHHLHQQPQQQQPQPLPVVQDAFSMLLSSTGVTGDYDTMYGNLGSIKQPGSSTAAANLNLYSNYGAAVSQSTYAGYGAATGSIFTSAGGGLSHAYGLDASYDQAKLAVYGSVQVPIATTATGTHGQQHHQHQVTFDSEGAAEMLYTPDSSRIRMKEEQQQLFLVDHGLALDVAPPAAKAPPQATIESLYAEQLAHSGLSSPVKGQVSTVSYSDRVSLGLAVKNEEIMYNERLNLTHHKAAEELDYGQSSPSNERLGFAHKSAEHHSSTERFKSVKEEVPSYGERVGGLGLAHKPGESAFVQRLALNMTPKGGTHPVYIDATVDLSVKAPHDHPTAYGDHLALELASKTNLTYCPQEVTLDLTSPNKSTDRLAQATAAVYGLAAGAVENVRVDPETDENAFRKSYNISEMAHGCGDSKQHQPDFGEQLAYELAGKVVDVAHYSNRSLSGVTVKPADQVDSFATYERDTTHAQLLLDAGRPRLAPTYHQTADGQQLESPDVANDDSRSPVPDHYQSPIGHGESPHHYQSTIAGQYVTGVVQEQEEEVPPPQVDSSETKEPYPASDIAHYPPAHYRSPGVGRSDMPEDGGRSEQLNLKSQDPDLRETFEPDTAGQAPVSPVRSDHLEEASCPPGPDVVQPTVPVATDQQESEAGKSSEYRVGSSGEEDYDENSCDSVQRSSASVSSGAPLDKEEEEEEVDSCEEVEPPSEMGPKVVPPKKSYTMNQSRMKASHHASSLLRQRRIFNSPKKIDRKSLYKHRPWQVEEESVDDKETPSTSSSQPTLADEFDDMDDEVSAQRPTLTRVTTWPTRLGDEAVTSVRCPKKFRELYAVVKNVKQAHQCHESGETQEFNDDIEYLLDGVQGTNSVGTRCLSILSLASKCMAPSFRMHLRAHGSLTKVFSALQDAPKDANLSLCTATVMFILSQDRLNMDLDRTSLELMLQLLETESSVSMTTISTTNGHNREYDKNKEKVRELCQEQQKKGYAKLLDLDNITPGVLAMETLLSLTSRRAGEWFKEELRELGGLDHLVNTVGECGQCLPVVVVQLREFALDKLRKLDRCLRVLENVTYMNSQNQAYLITCQNSTLIHYCSRALQLCESCLKVYPNPDINDRESPSWILFNCLLSVLKVLLNLTNDNPRGSAALGEQDGLMIAALSCVLYVPSHCETEQRFDILVLSLGLLINLVEHCDVNRHKLLYTELPLTQSSSHHRRHADTISAPKALVNLFSEHEEAARLEETKTDNLLDGKGEDDGDPSKPQQKGKDDAAAGTSSSTGIQHDDIEETLQKALQKAGKNMENSMIAAYIALLLGCLIQENRDSAARIRDHLPQKDFGGMVQMLKKYLNFMNLTNLVGSKGMKSIQRVIDILENT